MVKRFFQIILVTLSIYSCEVNQKGSLNIEAELQELLEYFQSSKYIQDSATANKIFENENYQISISNEPIPFDLKHIVLQKPGEKEYPISFSTVYSSRLISLFESGSFMCHTLPDLHRDTDFENKLNSRSFNYHWTINDKIVAVSEGEYFIYEDEIGWKDFEETIPMKSQPKLFEDDSFIAFCDCFGEFGGSVYFFDRATKNTHHMESVCANSILKKYEKYFVLSHLGHLMGESNIDVITSPNELTIIKDSLIGVTIDGFAYGYWDSLDVADSNHNFPWIDLYSSFLYKGETIYIVHWAERTFLAKIESSQIKIINPLFNNEIFTHNPITNSYGNWTLMNLDYYMIGGEREISMIIISDSQFIKVDWSRN